MLEYIAIAIALFFAANIGASGAAASMGVAYGSGAIKNAKFALLLCGIGVIAGAVLGGGEVVKTISGGIIPESIITVKLVIIILLAATSTLFIANLMGIPLSTSEVTVGSIVGVGVAYQVLYIEKLLYIMAFWFIVPIIAFLLLLIGGKILYHFQQKGYLKDRPLFTFLLIIAGFFEAFSAGMNNVANAVGPLVGANMMTITEGVWIGGVFVAVGALFLGRRVLETNGKKITRYEKTEGILISSTGALLVGISSIFGLPVPLTQVTSSGIIGLGVAKNGAKVFDKNIVKKILRIWIVSPLFSLAISYMLVKVFIESDYYSMIVLVSVAIAIMGAFSLMQIVREEEQTFNDEGSGI
ncbi:inorganic phosphate transporter [Lysinibacillus sp. LZ02]|uniref:inorganic phosphate transporter n=1 Tax=Lysinibacillus sp. LZ02 TaxID=3420668 RepID=UPI003D35A9FB